MIELLLAAVQSDWRLTCERTDYRETGRYAEMENYVQRLDRASTKLRAFSFGVSPQGRKLWAVLASDEPNLTPEKALKSGKPLIFAQGGIHSGEIEGKDAGLMLLRDIAIGKSQAGLLKKANFLFVPIFSVDAHERFGPYSRVNQNGPVNTGWRTTAHNLNLNRDYVKADAPEMQAMLRLMSQWKPDVFFDLHTTDGGDWQYVLTYDISRWPTQDPAVADFGDRMDKVLAPLVEKDGFVSGPYFGGVDPARPENGVSLDTYSPRFSHAYYGLKNRIAILVETHVLKEYRPRVLSTYSLLKHSLIEFGKRGAELKTAIRQADFRETKLKSGASITTGYRLKSEWRPWVFRGYPFTPYKSEVTGGMIRSWDRSKPTSFQSRIRDRFEAAGSVTLPAAYLIPAQWADVISRLSWHGIRTTRLNLGERGRVMELDVDLMTAPRFAATPNEGRIQPNFTTVPAKRKITIPDGSVLVRTNQPGARLIVQMCEPNLPDSFARWGFFNAVFQRTEYAEDYALEPFAAKMLASNPKLKAEFEAKKSADAAFAGNPSALLAWLYERSPLLDQLWQVHPIYRLTSAQLSSLVPARRG